MGGKMGSEKYGAGSFLHRVGKQVNPHDGLCSCCNPMKKGASLESEAIFLVESWYP